MISLARNKIKIIFFIFFCLFNSKAFSECDFKTGDYIKKLHDPKSIKLVSIEIPKSGKFNKDFAKIITSLKQNILPSLKKNYKGFVTVNYKFGRCKFKARIRQSGDWKDHVKLIDGHPIRSLDISLKEGNVLNAIKFKLLIPESRYDKNEILGSLILRELGFIAPETFHVLTEVNKGVKTLMLFQE